MDEEILYIVTVDFNENGDQTIFRTTFVADSEREIRQFLKTMKPTKRGISLDVSRVWKCKESDYMDMYEKHGLEFGTPLDLYATIVAMKKKGMLEDLYWE